MLQASCNLFGLFPGAFPFLSVRFGERQNAHVEGSYGIKGTVHMAMCLWFWPKHHNYNMVANVHSQHVFDTSIFLFRSLDEQWHKETEPSKTQRKKQADTRILMIHDDTGSTCFRCCKKLAWWSRRLTFQERVWVQGCARVIKRCLDVQHNELPRFARQSWAVFRSQGFFSSCCHGANIFWRDLHAQTHWHQVLTRLWPKTNVDCRDNNDEQHRTPSKHWVDGWRIYSIVCFLFTVRRTI